MKRLFILCILLVFFKIIYSLEKSDSIAQRNDTIVRIDLNKNYHFVRNIDYNQFNSKFQNRSLGNKILRGTAYAFGFNSVMGITLAVSPESITQWHAEDKFQIPVMLKQYRLSFTKAPVIDHDLWAVNYIGHPYQGGYYYNAMRSQGATILESSLFCLGQSLVWEYLWEGGMEQPSIQDLIVTPIVGGIIGELSHRATIKMSKNGYTLPEKIILCLLNPTYVLNNGFNQKSKVK